MLKLQFMNCKRFVVIGDVTAVATGKITFSIAATYWYHISVPGNGLSCSPGRKFIHLACNSIPGVRTGSKCWVIMLGKA